MECLNSILTDISIGVITFIATNSDDFFILLALFSSKKFGVRNVVAGQFFGIAALVFAGSLSYFLRLAMPLKVIGLLGIIPFILGVKEYFELFSKNESPEKINIEKKNGYTKTLTVFIITVANGSDNIAVYIPLFAAINGISVLTIALIYMLLTAGLLFVSYRLINNKIFGDKIKFIGKYLFPVVFIILGIFIFYKAGSYSLFIPK